MSNRSLETCRDKAKGTCPQTTLRCATNAGEVSFAEYYLFYRALLQKRPVILRSLLIVATPYRRTSRSVSHTMGWLRLVGSLKLDVS